MAKTKTRYVCQSCGAESSKWLGRCPSCNEWNSFVEEVVAKEVSRLSDRPVYAASTPIPIGKVDFTERKRIDTTFREVNRTLGGGLVPGSMILLGGEPGIGKSTLALQLALKMRDIKTLYISGEESAEQIKLRAIRLGDGNDNCHLLCETSLETILSTLEQFAPQMVIIDSIQTLQAEYIESSPGSVSQIRECSSRLLRYAKTSAVPVILIGHIVKDGSLAGPKVLEHMVDTVLQFEGDRQYFFRILRSSKNRFGSTSEIGIFEMQQSGLVEILNPSEILMSHSQQALSGLAIAAALNGMRPYMIETQALVSSAVYGTPQRSGTGFDFRRLNMLLAVLEKRAGFRLGAKDVFLNISGGIKVDDPAIDLAVAAAILSSNADVAIPQKTCLCGEISLSGEVRPVYRIEQRIAEAEKLGFERIILAHSAAKNNISAKHIKTVYISKIEQLPKLLFG
ncbi:MAG TPA: DNA repair protein RadA [Bacteroidales bacterium]